MKPQHEEEDMKHLRLFARAIWDHLVYDMPLPDWFLPESALCSNWGRYVCLHIPTKGAHHGYYTTLNALLNEHAGDDFWPFGRTVGPNLWTHPWRLAFLCALADDERPLECWRDYIVSRGNHTERLEAARRDRERITQWCQRMVHAFDYGDIPSEFSVVSGICYNLRPVETSQIRAEFGYLAYPFGGSAQYAAEAYEAVHGPEDISTPGTLWANPQRRAWVRKRAEGKPFHLSDIL